MRIPGTKIYRAFPELDPYPDERCEKFMRAARGSRKRHFARRAAVALFTIGAMFASGYGLNRLGISLGWLSGYSWSSRDDPLVNVIIILSIIAGTALGVLFRDWLLRRRVRDVLRTRGTCPGCRYALIGLPVAADHTVTCPECAMQVEVDPALGELAVDSAGRPRFTPNEAALNAHRFWTPRRKRLLRRTLAYGSLALIALGLLSIAGFEWFVRHQAAVAKRERPTLADLNALIVQAQPAEVPNDAPNAWDAFNEAVRLRHIADQAVQESVPPNPDPEAQQVVAYFDYIYNMPTSNDANQQRNDLACRDLALETHRQYKAHGVYDALAKVAQTPRTTRTIDGPDTDAWFNSILFPEFSQMRHFARASAASAYLARQNRDHDRFLRSIESGLAMARLANSGPFSISPLVAYAIENLVATQIIDWLNEHPNTEHLDQLSKILDRQSYPADLQLALKSEHLFAQNMIAHAFISLADGGLRKYTKPREVVSEALGGFPVDGPLGTYAANRRANDFIMNELVVRAKEPRWTRSDSSPAFDKIAKQDYMLISTIWGSSSSFASADQAALTRTGVRTMIALERYRNRTGSYPAALADLVPADLPELPIDLCTGGPLLYRAIPATHTTHATYVLYSTGADNTDDGGTPWRVRSLRRSNNGTDFVFNTKEMPYEPVTEETTAPRSQDPAPEDPATEPPAPE